MISINKLAVALATGAVLVNGQSDTDPVTGLLGNATVVENNPVGPVYTATLPTVEFFDPTNPSGNIVGVVTGTAAESGIGVDFEVHFSNLPTSGGPFLYHIHDQPVPSDGNCTGTLGHLDPFIRGETPTCDSVLPQTCQVGDLSGKYGKITSDPFVANYTDLFASTLPGIGAFFGNRSITVHYANATRITCANFTLEGTAVSSGSGSANTSSGITGPSVTSSVTTSTSTAGASTTPSVQPFTGDAAILQVQTLFWGLTAVFLFL